MQDNSLEKKLQRLADGRAAVAQIHQIVAADRQIPDGKAGVFRFDLLQKQLNLQEEVQIKQQQKTDWFQKKQKLLI